MTFYDFLISDDRKEAILGVFSQVLTMFSAVCEKKKGTENKYEYERIKNSGPVEYRLRGDQVWNLDWKKGH